MQHFDLSGSQNYLASRSLFVSTCGEECWCFAVLHVSFPKRMELPWPCCTATGDIVQVDQQGGVALIVALAQSTFEKKQLPIAKCISWLVNLPPHRSRGWIRPYKWKPMVNKPLIRHYFLGGTLTSHKHSFNKAWPASPLPTQMHPEKDFCLKDTCLMVNPNSIKTKSDWDYILIPGESKQWQIT